MKVEIDISDAAQFAERIWRYDEDDSPVPSALVITVYTALRDWS